jgi:hypothetical protein
MPAGFGSPCTDLSLYPFNLIIDVATRQLLVVIIPCGRVCLIPVVQSDETATAAFCLSSNGIHVNPSGLYSRRCFTLLLLYILPFIQSVRFHPTSKGPSTSLDLRHFLKLILNPS